MSKFLVAGILQREAIVKIESLPLKFQAVTDIPNSVHYGVGGDSYNEAIALKWLGDDVDFFTMIGMNDDPSIVNSNANDITLTTDFILPKLNATASAVIFYDKLKQQQIFEDIKDLRETPYDLKLYKKEISTADMCVFANCNFCRPLLEEAKKADKKIAVNIRNFKYETEQYNADFLSNADILYLSDDRLDEDPIDFVKYITEKYSPEVVILGQGAQGVTFFTKKLNTYTYYNSVKTNEVVNTVGAGNALFSCFLHYYNKTSDEIYSIKNALLFASYKIGFVGTSNGFMTEKQIEDWRDLIWKKSDPFKENS